jgi:hypothetical protein
MIPEFSEFSFGFALVHELANGFGRQLGIAPVFPSLYAEGQPGGGYDVALTPGFPLFLQFKLSEYMVRRTASEWHLFGQPYYRFWMHAPRHSEQHALLLDLDVDPNLVYYVAPRIHTSQALNDAFLAEDLVTNSVFVRPRHIAQLPSDGYHCIAFSPVGIDGWICSEPRRTEIDAVGRHFYEAIGREKNRTARTRSAEEVFGGIVDKIQSKAIRRAGRAALSEYPQLHKRSLRDQAAYLSRTILGAELFWVTSSAAGLGQ